MFKSCQLEKNPQQKEIQPFSSSLYSPKKFRTYFTKCKIPQKNKFNENSLSPRKIALNSPTKILKQSPKKNIPGQSFDLCSSSNVFVIKKKLKPQILKINREVSLFDTQRKKSQFLKKMDKIGLNSHVQIPLLPQQLLKDNTRKVMTAIGSRKRSEMIDPWQSPREKTDLDLFEIQ